MNLLNNKDTSIDRAINEFRSGRPIIISVEKSFWIFFTLENLNKDLLIKMKNNKSGELFSFITNKKAVNLSLKSIKHKQSVYFPIKINNIEKLRFIHTNYLKKSDKIKFKKVKLNKSPKFINDVLDLAKNAKKIPCIIGFKLNKELDKNLFLKFNYKKISNQSKLIANSTKFISQSYLPILKDYKAKIMVFESFIGGLEHVVIKIGLPKNKNPINLRIQSTCLTGEVFHSMKCDCNEQLQQSIDYLKNNGGGYIIHLEQEGRGIGLANKIKAYDLQNKGLDTYNADINMGFLGDERDFSIAINILKFLKIKNVNLITNNRDKINILKKNNIKINKIIPTKPSLNSYNIQYLASRSKKMNYNIKGKYIKGS